MAHAGPDSCPDHRAGATVPMAVRAALAAGQGDAAGRPRRAVRGAEEGQARSGAAAAGAAFPAVAAPVALVAAVAMPALEELTAESSSPASRRAVMAALGGTESASLARWW
jgi:hypothetical protein